MLGEKENKKEEFQGGEAESKNRGNFRGSSLRGAPKEKADVKICREKFHEQWDFCAAMAEKSEGKES